MTVLLSTVSIILGIAIVLIITYSILKIKKKGMSSFVCSYTYKMLSYVVNRYSV